MKLEYIFNFLVMFFIAILILIFVLINVMILIYLERKISARFQSRLGPMRTAWPKNFHGWAQPIADAIKMLIKEDIIPKNADKIVFNLAPVLVMTVSYLLYIVIPFSKGEKQNFIVKDLNIGVLYLIAISSLTVIGIVMGGWASNNKYSLFGALRSAAQIVSYEIPLVLSILVIVMFTGSLSMVKIVEAQNKIPFILSFPAGTIAFLIYLISATAELNRVPFDIPEGESEIVAGYNTEYSGMKFAFFFLAEFSNMFAISLICATLFLGGWQGPTLPFIPPEILRFFYLMIKCYFIVFLLMWFRWTYPRVRVDQLMEFSWKFLIPLSFLNLGIAGIFMLIKGV
jgi:NADH-quinone oxidoreductase subunit H